MNHKFIIIWAIIFLIQFVSVAFSSSILDPSAVGVGARPLGMGKAYVALADDASAIFMNPGGLSQIKSFNFVSMRATLAGDINYTVLSGVVPLSVGSIGVGLVNSAIGGIPLTRWTVVSGVSRPETYAYTDYSSNVLLVSYGAKLNELFKNEKLQNISLGASLKYFLQSFSESTGSMEGANGSGMDLDLGIKWRANKWLNLGLAAYNLLPENMGGRFNWQRNSVVETIPASIKIGGAANFIGKNGLRHLGNVEATWLFDVEKSMQQSSIPLLMHTGFEIWPAKMLAIRFGLDQQMSSSTSGPLTETNMTFGIGIKFAQFSFDYSYHKYGEVAENTTHYFSIGYAQEIRQKAAPPVSPAPVFTFPYKK